MRDAVHCSFQYTISDPDETFYWCQIRIVAESFLETLNMMIIKKHLKQILKTSLILLSFFVNFFRRQLSAGIIYCIWTRKWPQPNKQS